MKPFPKLPLFKRGPASPGKFPSLLPPPFRGRRPTPSPKVRALIRALSAGAGRVPGFTNEMFKVIEKEFLERGDVVWDEARQRLQGLINANRGFLPLGANIVKAFGGQRKAQRFATQVLAPAKARKLSSSEAWARTNSIAGFDVLRSAEQNAPGWTVGIAGGLDVGCVIGLEGAVGLAGMRHKQAFIFVDGAFGTGAYVKVGGGFKVVFAPGTPSEFSGPALGIDIGGTYYVGLSIGGAIIPSAAGRLFTPAVYGYLTMDDLDSITVGVPVGFGLEAAITFSGTKAFPLTGNADTGPVEEPKPEEIHAPTELTGRFSGNGVLLQWKDNSDNETGFMIARASPDLPKLRRVAEVGANTATYKDTSDLAPGTYEYRVAAVKNGSYSSFSNPVSVTVPQRNNGRA